MTCLAWNHASDCSRVAGGLRIDLAFGDQEEGDAINALFFET